MAIQMVETMADVLLAAATKAEPPEMEEGIVDDKRLADAEDTKPVSNAKSNV